MLSRWTKGTWGRIPLLGVLLGSSVHARDGDGAVLSAQARAEQVGGAAIVPLSAWDQVGRSIESGLRVESLPDGQVRVAESVFPSGGEALGVELPARLGGGFLFYQAVADVGNSATALWRADSWTAPLEPLSSLPFAAEVVAGFDRLYALSGGVQIAVDAADGRWLPLEPMPPVASIERLVFSPGGQVAALQAPVVGLLATGDGGRSWLPIDEVVRVNDQLGLDVGWECSLEGSCSVIELKSQGEQPERVRIRARSERVKDVVLSGVPWRSKRVALLEGNLVELEPDGRLNERSSPLNAQSECQGLSLANHRAVFLCRGPDRGAWLFQEGKLEAWATFDDFVPLAVGAHGVLATGACGKRANSLCLTTASGSRRLGGAPIHSQTFFALGGESDPPQSVWMVRRRSREGKRGPGLLIERLDTPGGRAVFVPYPKEEAMAGLLRQGSWLPGPKRMRSNGNSGFAFWVAQGERVAGVFVSDEGDIVVGAIQRPLRRALLAGQRALLWGAAGFAKQTVDHGMTWQELGFPFRSGDPDPHLALSEPRAHGGATRQRMGCSAAGCVVGRFARLGWGRPPEQAIVDVPDTLAIPPPGGGRHRFVCHDSGQSSAPALSSDSRGLAASVRRYANYEADALQPFWERAAPATHGAALAVSIPAEHGLAQFDAWGPDVGSWTRSGFARVAFRDPFTLDGIRSTATSVGVFSSAVQAQEALGLLDRSARMAEVALDPSGDLGMLVLRQRSDSRLFVFESGKPLRQFPDAEAHGVRALSGAVFAYGEIYFSVTGRSQLRVLRLSSGNIEPVAEFPLYQTGARGGRVVRTTDGKLGVLIQGDRGILIYPLTRSGQLGSALLIPHQGSHPPPCPAEARGFVFDELMSIEPYVEDAEGRLDLDRVQARLIAGYGKPCLLGMAAETRRDVSASGAPQAQATIPLVVTDVGSTGRRRLLLCR